MVSLNFVLNLLIILLVLSFLVIIHELGHYVVARRMKIKVEEFGLGYPPRAKKLFTRWGTIFSLNWIPFGGFVRMDGEDLHPQAATKETSAQVEGPFYTKSVPARLAVILAGATVNLIFGMIAFSVVFSWWGIPGGAQINAIVPDSPAAAAGIRAGDVIVGLQNHDQFYEVRNANQLFAVIAQNYGQPVTVMTQAACGQVLCSGPVTDYQTHLRPADEVSNDVPALGVEPVNFSQFYPWYEMPFRSAAYGITEALALGYLIVQALFTMVSNLVTQLVVPQEVMGPVGIVHEASRNDLFSQGPLAVLLFAGLISINLAVMNVLPIPALDGGRAVFILLEKMIGKRRISKVEYYANYGGYAALLALIFLITARDIFRIIQGG